MYTHIHTCTYMYILSFFLCTGSPHSVARPGGKPQIHLYAPGAAVRKAPRPGGLEMAASPAVAGRSSYRLKIGPQLLYRLLAQATVIEDL